MKKLLPLVVLLLGIGVLVGAYVFIKGRGGDEDTEEEKVAEIAFDKRPVTSLTPSADGHWLKLKIEKFGGLGESLDYELLYQLPDGRTQGVPGSITLASESTIERDLLLGSESRGKYTYDEGVKEGTLTIRFRNSKGKLTAKFSTDFALLSNTDLLGSTDSKFSYKLSKASKEFFVVMNTFGAPSGYSSQPVEGPYGVFSSSESTVTGNVSLSGGKIEGFMDGKWEQLQGEKSSDIGIFMATP